VIPILEVAAAATSELLGHAMWEDGLTAVLARLGDAADSAWVELAEWQSDDPSDHHLRRRWRWTAEGSSFEQFPGDREPAAVDPAGWKDDLGRHGCLAVGAGIPTGAGVQTKAGPAIVPMIVVPVRAGDGWWGRLAVDAAGGQWSEPAVSALSAVARALGVVIGLQLGRRLATYLEQAVETLSVGVTIRDTEGRIIYTNPAEAAMHGYSIEEISGLLSRQLAPEESWRVERRPDASWLLGWRRERLNRRKDGSIFPVQLTSVALRNASDEVVAVATICEDISERRRIEVAMRRSEEHYRGLFHAAKDAIIVLDPDEYLILDANPRACQLYGYGRTEFVGMPLGKIARDVTREKDHVDEALERDRSHTFETVHRTGDGSEIVFEVTASVLVREGRDVLLCINRDISERKRAEETLEASREQLRNLADHLQAAREEERMAVARTIHDELGQVMTALKMDVAWLGKRLPEDTDGCRSKIETMLKLIDQAVGTVQRLTTELRPALLDDLGLSAAAEWFVKDFAARTGIECVLDLGRPEVELDRNRSTAVFRILQEALTNVARHADAARVEISLGVDDDTVVLSVRDDGRGIEQDQISSPRSFGLLGIRERTAALGGEAFFSRIPEGGSEVLARIPVLPGRGGEDDPGADL